MKSRVRILALMVALSLVAAGVTLANGGLELPREVLGGGASDSAAPGVGLRATLGQPVVGVVTGGGGDVTLAQGFWRGASLPEGGREVYLPLIQR